LPEFKEFSVLERIRKGQRWLTAIFVFAIGIVFVFFLGLGGSTPGGGGGGGLGTEVVVLDDVRIRMNDYQRVRKQQSDRLQNSLGDQFDADAMSSFLDAQALQAVVNQVVLSQSAGELGLVASPEEVKDILRNDPGLRDESGRFIQDEFDAQIKWEFGSQANFLASMQRDLLQQKMFELVMSQVEISDAEAFSAARYRTEEARIAFVALGAETLPESQKPDEATVVGYLAANRDALLARYDADVLGFATPEKVSLRHILLKPDGGTETAATANRERAELIRARLDQGEDFAAVAAEVSDDESTRENGGSLGEVPRGDVAPSLEAAAFSLDVGAVSEVIDGIEGLHILKVDAKTEAGRKSFDEVGLELAADGAAAEAARGLADRLAEAIKGGESLEDAARAADLTLERTSFFTRRRDGFIPGLSRPSLDILSTAFTLSTEAPSSPRVFDVGDDLVLIQLIDRQDPDPATLAGAVETARESLELQQQNSLIQAWIDDRKELFESEQRLQINSALVAGG
jgi:peptidyl-prolyl cis-trans isomerase D